MNPYEDAPPPLQKKENGRVTLIRQYKLITPLYGGGVIKNEVDTSNPIRGTAVRGQLRFWWRATRGGRYDGSLKKMKAAEDAIWGSTETGSKIAITILKSNLGEIYQVGRNGDLNVGDPNSPLGYVAFPLRESQGTVYENVTFTMKIDCPKSLRPDLKAALWAWETFGGIGARTRRGFGAIYCTEAKLTIDNKKFSAKNWIWAYKSHSVEKELIADIERFVPKRLFHEHVSHLSNSTKRTHATLSQDDGYDAWKILIDALSKFRQSRKLRDIRGNMRPFGRSHWPEPDAIRDLTEQAFQEPGGRDHSTPINNSPPVYKFPRAAFGLPIVFEFKREDRHDSRTDRDPRTTQLEGIDYERRASRLILRPLRCDDGKYVGVATILEGLIIPPGRLKLKNSSKNPPRNAEILEIEEATQIQEKNKHYDGDVDILQAFINSIP